MVDSNRTISHTMACNGMPGTSYPLISSDLCDTHNSFFYLFIHLFHSFLLFLSFIPFYYIIFLVGRVGYRVLCVVLRTQYLFPRDSSIPKSFPTPNTKF